MLEFIPTANMGTLAQNCPGRAIVHFPDGEEPSDGILVQVGDVYQLYDETDFVVAVFTEQDVNRWNTYYHYRDGHDFGIIRRVYLNK